MSLLKSIIPYSVAVASLWACSPKKEATKPDFAGHWICQNAHDSVLVAGSVVRSSLPPFEVVFRSNTDSMLYVNAFEMAKFPVRRRNDTQYEIIGFIRDSTSVFTLGTDGHLTLVAGDGQIRFFRADSNLAMPIFGQWKASLPQFYTKTFVAGEYQTLDKKKVDISEMGAVRGWNFSKIDLIMGGDEASGDIDMAYLTNINGEKEKMGWKLAGKKLSFFSVKNLSQPTEKPYWQAEKEVFVLMRR